MTRNADKKEAYRPAYDSARLTPHLQSIIRPGNPADPVAAQYLYDTREEEIRPDEAGDPIGDDVHSPLPGLVHRYPDRVLLKVTDTCMAYCRFCFRREMVGQGKGVLPADAMDRIYRYIESAPKVREVIFSGGDPLTLSNARLEKMISRFSAMPNIDFLRIHTRAPLMSPDRVDEGLLSLLRSCEKPVYMVLHVNHADEIRGAVKTAFRALAAAGVILMSQSVLLKGVNDSAPVLEDLFRTLLSCRVRPYYLHHLDRAPGTSHFRVPLSDGQAIMAALHARLSGLALPHYVLDIPGGFGKVPVGPSYLKDLGRGEYAVMDDHGTAHRYREGE